MIKYKYPVHYLTEKIDLYKIFCDNKKECSSIILVNSKNYTIDGNFLEKYLTMFLKLKAAISGAAFHFIDNLFYNIEYITYISIGHGISMFKHYLYYGKNYYGPKRFILISIILEFMKKIKICFTSSFSFIKFIRK